jgi:hypothetical protein
MHKDTVDVINRNIVFIERISRNFFPFWIIAKNFLLVITVFHTFKNGHVHQVRHVTS